MIRKDWKVQKTAAELAQAARARYEYRTQRVVYWGNVKDELANKIQTEGLVVTDTLVDQLARDGYSTQAGTASNNFNPVGNGPRVTVDQTMMKQLHEAYAKLEENRNKVREYGLWLAMLGSAPGSQVFDLDHDDWRFFFEV